MAQLSHDEFKKAVSEEVAKQMADSREAEIKAEKKNTLQQEFAVVHADAQNKAEAKGYEKDEAILGKIALLMAKSGGMDPEHIMKLNAKTFESKEINGYMKKTLEAGVPSAGGFTIPRVLSPNRIPALYANTILDKVNVPRIPLGNGNIELSRLDTKQTIYWVGEIAVGTATNATFGSVKLNAKKLQAFTEVSNTLIRTNIVGIEGWVQEDMANQFRIALDTAFLYGTGSAYQPLGMNGQGVQTIGTSSTAIDQLQPELMLAMLEAANVPIDGDVKWIFSPHMKNWLMNLKTTTGAWIFREEMVKFKTLAGYEFVVSTTSSYTDTSTDYADIWLGNWNWALWGVGLDMEMRMVRDAAFTTGGTTYSTTTRESSLIIVTGEHDFGIKNPLAVVKGIYSVT